MAEAQEAELFVCIFYQYRPKSVTHLCVVFEAWAWNDSPASGIGSILSELKVSDKLTLNMVH